MAKEAVLNYKAAPTDDEEEEDLDDDDETTQQLRASNIGALACSLK